MTLPFLQPVTDLIVAALGDRLSPGVTDYLDLFAEYGVLETPYVPAGAISTWRGKTDIERFLSGLEGTMVQESMTLTHHWPIEGGAVLEYSGRIRRMDVDATFDQEYVAVLLLDGGRLCRFREYSNPVRVSEAVGGSS